MKKILKKACKAAASAALTATKVTVNSTCVFYAHQAKEFNKVDNITSPNSLRAQIVEKYLSVALNEYDEANIAYLYHYNLVFENFTNDYRMLNGIFNNAKSNIRGCTAHSNDNTRLLESTLTANVKFEEFAEQWFEEYAKLNLRSTSYERMRKLTPRIYPVLGHLRLDKITGRHIQQFINDLLINGKNLRNGKPLSRKTVIHHLSFISDVFGYDFRL